MSLFEDASLIVTPNGRKAGKIHALKPFNGTGDLTVVRATTKTEVNASGVIVDVPINVPSFDYTNGSCPSILVEPQRTNLFLRSSEFENAYWSKMSGLTPIVLANSMVSPSYLTDADKITPNSTLATHWIGKTGFSLTSGVTYSYSVFAKNNGFNVVLSKTVTVCENVVKL